MYMLERTSSAKGGGENKNERKREEDEECKNGWYTDEKNKEVEKGRGRKDSLIGSDMKLKLKMNKNKKSETEYLIEIDPRSHLEVADYPKHR